MSAVLDNVPNCPELLSQKNLTSTSVQLEFHLNHALVPSSLLASYVTAPQFPVKCDVLVGVTELLPTSGAALPLPHAADSSPPSI